GRRGRRIFLREELAVAPAEMGANGDGLERKQQSSNELLPRQQSADAGLGREPGRSRAPHVAREKGRYRPPYYDGVRSRSRRAGRHRPMLPGRVLAARFVEQNEIEIVRQDERLEKLSRLRAAEHVGDVRSNERFIARARPTSRARTWKSRHLEHVENRTERKSVRRLEPERRTQNDDLRLLVARQGRTERFNSGHLGRSCQLFKKEKSRSFEIPLRPSPRPCRKKGGPLRARRKTETKTAEEMERVSAKRPLVLIALVCVVAGANRAQGDDFPLRKLRPFTYTVDYEPFWSPDGRQVGLISIRHGGMKVHVMDASNASHGSDMRQLTFGDAEDDTPAWSPDGKKIAFVSIRNGVSQIFVMNADGTDVRQLTKGIAENIHPTWSPDSERILFNTTYFVGATAADGRNVPSDNKVIGEQIDKKMDLATIRPDGTDLKQITTGGGFTYASFSPDGMWIVHRRINGALS